MLTHEQVIAYLEETLPPEQAAGVEADFAADAAATHRLTDLAEYESALRTLLGGDAELARIEESVLAAVQEKSLPQTEARAPRATTGQMPDHRSNHVGKNEEKNMSDRSPSKSPKGDNDLTKDQLAAQGIQTDPSGSDRRAAERYREDLADEAKWEKGAGEKDASPKPTPAPEAEKQGEDNDYYNGLSP